MRRACLLTLVLWFPVQDLALASIYSVTEWPGVGHVRALRDAVCLVVAAVAVLRLPLPRRLFLAMAVYVLLVSLYVPVGLANGVRFPVVASGAGTLVLPIVLVLVGFCLHRTPGDLRLSGWLLVGVALASALFGAWEVHDTGFWTYDVRYGDYLRDIKGIVTGYEPTTGLPWNFFGHELRRRAGGLLAAPLAQGAFLVVAAMASVGLTRSERPWLGLTIAALLSCGVYQSGTRGAMLMGLLALGTYLWVSARGLPTLLVNVQLALLATVLASTALADVISYTIGQHDSSTAGHLLALQTNLSRIHLVWLLGYGVGTEGAIAARENLDRVGGGEGAIFTIAYQIGVPGALAFLYFYVDVLRRLLAGMQLRGQVGDVCAVTAALAVGVTSTFVTSEHVLSFSGMAAFWILAGGAVRVAGAERARVARAYATRPAPGVAHARPAPL